MRWSRLTGFSLVLIATQAIVGCSDDGDDVPGSTAGSAGKGGGSTAGSGGKSTAGSNSTAGKGGSGGAFVNGGDTSTAGTDTAGTAGSGGTGGTPECTEDSTCDDQDPCTDDACTDGACTHEDNTADCDDENACTSGDKCDAGECKGTNNTDDCDDLSECTPGQDKCADGKCGGAVDLVACPACDVPENKILNCSFTKGDNPPGLESWETQFTFDGGGADQTVINERDVIDIRVGGTKSWNVQPLQKGLNLTQGMKYKVRIVAGASVDRQITVSITKFDAPYQVYSDEGSKYGGWDFDLTQQMKFFEREFRFTGMVAVANGAPAGDEPNAKIEIKVGNREFEEPVPDYSGSSVYFDDVYLAEVPCVGDGECNDDNDCTTDKCEASGACSNTAVEDDTACAADEDACTNDVCKVGKCEHPVADDHDPCTDDADLCTVDECIAGACKHNFDNVACGCKKDEDCNDDKDCTDDTCDVDTGECETAFNTADCDDKNGCTMNDKCDGAGLCQGTGDITAKCNDTDVCTVQNMCLADGNCGPGTNVCFDCTVGGNLVTNCDFAAAGIEGWLGSYIANPANATLSNTNGMLNVVITGTDDADYKIQPLFQFITLTEGVQYEVKFNAYSTIARKAKFTISRANADYSSYFPDKLPIEIDLTTEMQQFTFTYTQPPTEQTAKFEFDLGGAAYNPTLPNTVFIDNVFIAPVQ